MKRILLAFALASLVACDDSSSSSSSGNSDPLREGPHLGFAKTFVVGSDSMLPFVGGYLEGPKEITRNGASSLATVATLNFIGSPSSGSLRFNGSVLVYQIGVGTFPLDTTYSAQPPSGNISFFRYNAGEDSCYYSSVSGTLHVTTWRDTTINGSAGHLASGSLDASMAFPWEQKRRKSCPEALKATLAFTEAFIRNDD